MVTSVHGVFPRMNAKRSQFRGRLYIILLLFVRLYDEACSTVYLYVGCGCLRNKKVKICKSLYSYFGKIWITKREILWLKLSVFEIIPKPCHRRRHLSSKPLNSIINHYVFGKRSGRALCKIRSFERRDMSGPRFACTMHTVNVCLFSRDTIYCNPENI